MSQNHHIVQKKYLEQWLKEGNNQLNIYVIPENKIISRGSNWKGFKRKDFNIDSNSDDFYLPEKITAHIDNEGLKVIKKIKFNKELEGDGYDRSALVFYVALQYLRTPKNREELNKLTSAMLKLLMKKDIKSPNDIKLSKKEILYNEPKNNKEREALEQIKKMTESELRERVHESLFVHNNDWEVYINNSGHSKSIYKVDRYAKDLFEKRLIFLFTPRETSFITSDSPCFAISFSSLGAGLLSPNGAVLFPLRPDLCLLIDPRHNDKQEYFQKISKKYVRQINLLILQNAYNVIVTRDRRHMENIIKKYDYKNHRKIRDLEVKEFGDYIITTFK